MQADVFCRVVDNFGDVGVTWRLARQLQREHNWSLRLWVDDLNSFQRLESRINSCVAHQIIDQIEVIHWVDPVQDLIPHPIVLCSFSCDLPDTYIARLRHRPALWLNLEYLSAEAWVDGCHGLPSLRGDGLSSHFFFPGFNEHTGGLLRERDLFSQRDQWQTNPDGQKKLLETLGVSAGALAGWQPAIGDHQPARLLNLFCYPHAPVAQLLEAICADSRRSIVLIPDGIAPELTTRRIGPFEQVYLERIPFVSQPDYDRLLWMADLNFVRGEDSLVRALWSGKPLIWQIYPQTEDTHLIKLDAWLALSDLASNIQDLMRGWNAACVSAKLSEDFTQALSEPTYTQWLRQSRHLSDTLAQKTDFAQALHNFCVSKTAL